MKLITYTPEFRAEAVKLVLGLCRVSDLRLRFAGEEWAAFKLDGFVLLTHKIVRRTMCEQRLQS